MSKMLLQFLRFNPNAFSFISGVVISVSMNLCTEVAVADWIPARAPVLLVSSLLLLTGGVFWALLAWRLDLIMRLTLLDAPTFVEADEAWEAMAMHQVRSLSIILIGAFMSSILGFVMLFIR